MCKILQPDPDNPRWTRIRLCYRFGPHKGHVVSVLVTTAADVFRNKHYAAPGSPFRQIHNTRRPHERCQHGNLLPHDFKSTPHWHRHYCFQCQREQNNKQREATMAQ
jgi:hypothetical protein